MIVDRRVFQVKQGRLEEVVELLKAASEGFSTQAYRIYTPEVAEFDVVVIEWEYEDYQEMQSTIAAWVARLKTTDHWEKWGQVTAPGGRREIWQLAAQR